jgi:hypothetical protein
MDSSWKGMKEAADRGAKNPAKQSHTQQEWLLVQVARNWAFPEFHWGISWFSQEWRLKMESDVPAIWPESGSFPWLILCNTTFRSV